MKRMIQTFSAFILMSSVFAGECPRPNEHSATAFKLIAEASGTDLRSFLQVNTVAKTARNENCEDMYQHALKKRNEGARQVLENIGYGPKTKEEINQYRSGGSYYSYALTYSSIPVIKELRNRGGEESSFQNEEATIAARENSYEVIDWLLGGSNVTDTVFVAAVKSNKIQVIDQLIRRGADVSGKGVYSAAIYQKDLKILEHLIRAGMSVDVIARDEWKGIEIAAALGNLEMFEMLREAGASITNPKLPYLAMESGNVKILKHLVTLGLSMDYVKESGENLFHTAIRLGHKDQAAFLLTQGHDVNSVDLVGNNAFAYNGVPLYYKTANMAPWLRSIGGNIDSKNMYGATALMVATSENNITRMNYLLEAGARTDVKDMNGNTALHKAIKNSNQKGASELIRRGKEVNAKNDDGFTPLHLAANIQKNEEGRDLIIRLLLASGANKHAVVKVQGKKRTAYDFYQSVYSRDAELEEILKP